MGAKGAGKRGREMDLFGEADANERGRFHNGIESSDGELSGRRKGRPMKGGDDRSGRRGACTLAMGDQLVWILRIQSQSWFRAPGFWELSGPSNNNADAMRATFARTRPR